MDQPPTCIECGADLAWDNHAGHVPTRCLDCKRRRNADRQRKWRQTNPDRSKAIYDRSNAKRQTDPNFLRRRREAAARRLYGIEPGDVERLIEQQQGRCAICGGGPNGPGSRLHIDHCHESKRIRGMLCGRCNTLLGLAHEDINVLQAAILYLQR